MATHDWPRFRFVEPDDASLSGSCVGDEFDYASADGAMARALEYLAIMAEYDHVSVVECGSAFAHLSVPLGTEEACPRLVARAPHHHRRSQSQGRSDGKRQARRSVSRLAYQVAVARPPDRAGDSRPHECYWGLPVRFRSPSARTYQPGSDWL